MTQLSDKLDLTVDNNGKFQHPSTHKLYGLFQFRGRQEWVHHIEQEISTIRAPTFRRTIYELLTLEYLSYHFTEGKKIPVNGSFQLTRESEHEYIILSKKYLYSRTATFRRMIYELCSNTNDQLIMYLSYSFTEGKKIPVKYDSHGNNRGKEPLI